MLNGLIVGIFYILLAHLAALPMILNGDFSSYGALQFGELRNDLLIQDFYFIIGFLPFSGRCVGAWQMAAGRRFKLAFSEAGPGRVKLKVILRNAEEIGAAVRIIPEMFLMGSDFKLRELVTLVTLGFTFLYDKVFAVMR